MFNALIKSAKIVSKSFMRFYWILETTLQQMLEHLKEIPGNQENITTPDKDMLHQIITAVHFW